MDFESCLKLVLKHEGGYVNHPKDPGGATNRGITQATYDGWRSGRNLAPRSVRLITDREVSAIYRRDYWDAVRADDLPSGVDYAVFDFAVNSGVSRASRFLQEACGAHQDGKIGPATVAAVKKMAARSVVIRLCEARLHFLQSLKTWPTFGKGWGSRVAEVKEAALKAS